MKNVTHYVQVLWYCDVCKAHHFGNCPKVKVTLTTSKPIKIGSAPSYGESNFADVEVESTWVTHMTIWNKQNAKSMIAIYKSELYKTPFWRIFKRHQLKTAIKLWQKVKKSTDGLHSEK